MAYSYSSAINTAVWRPCNFLYLRKFTEIAARVKSYARFFPWDVIIIHVMFSFAIRIWLSLAYC